MKKRFPHIVIFLGSFLIFGIQPLLGRTLLPFFGGTASVWVVCLAAYQVLLLAGYAYAHRVANDACEAGALSASKKRVCGVAPAKFHSMLLCAAVLWTLAFAYFRPALKAHIGHSGFPALEVLFCVLAFVGLPYVLLSANSTLVQAWVSSAGQFQRAMKRSGFQGSNVYALYAVSNAGSLLGLLCYPFLVEPFLSLDTQWYGFTVCLALYGLLLAFLARETAAFQPATIGSEVNEPESEPAADRSGAASRFSSVSALWIALPATSSFLLNAVTTHLSMDVTPIPLLWVVLLAAFLISYIIGFSKLGEKGVWFWGLVAVVPLLGCAYALKLTGGRGFQSNLVCGLFLVLLGSTFLHSWLYSLRPTVKQLTRFYLCIALGGALGGVCSGIVAPLVFNAVFEYPLVLFVLAAFLVMYLRKHTPSVCKPIGLFFLFGTLASVVILIGSFSKKNVKFLYSWRNFYGCISVRSVDSQTRFGDRVGARALYHGDTLHGVQFEPHYLRDKPSTYYGPLGGGFAVFNHPNYASGEPMRVGVVGLGIGTMACWGRTNDTYRFFEINQRIIDIASDTNYFTYLSASAAKTTTVLGDARQVLTSETNTYDVLIIDAYSGDSIPYHLATQEAFQLYFNRLSTNGVLAVHISNWHIDLFPLCKAVSGSFGVPCYGITSPAQDTFSAANWVFLTRLPWSMKNVPVREIDWAQVEDIALPHDEKGSLLSLIRLMHVPKQKPFEFDFSAPREK